MNSSKIKEYLSLFIVYLIGSLFIAKYSFLYLENVILPLSFYTVFFFLIIYLKNKKSIYTNRYNKYLILTTAILSLSQILLFNRIGSIGRIPSINDWWSLLMKGIFPYLSDLTPSSFPGLFILSAPFYFMGKPDFIIALGILILLFILIRYKKDDELILAHILFLSTPIVVYEFAVRSELTFNVMLIILTCYLYEDYFKYKKISKNFLIILSGIALSTRSVVFIIFGFLFLYRVKKEGLKNINLFILPAIFFVLLLLPFIFWDFNDFITRGPFAIQSLLSNIPNMILVVFIFLGIILGYFIKDIDEIFTFSGYLLFLMIIVSYLLKVFQFGFFEAFYNDKIDLSYLAFLQPLLILPLIKNK